MANAITMQNQLRKSLGKEYEIKFIDLERVIYRDFGNGFNVEISCTRTVRLTKPANIYLWFGNSCLVKSVFRVPRENIGTVVDELFASTQRWLKEGYDTSDKLYHAVNNNLLQ